MSPPWGGCTAASPPDFPISGGTWPCWCPLGSLICGGGRPCIWNRADRGHQQAFHYSLHCMLWGNTPQLGLRHSFKRAWEQDDMERDLVKKREGGGGDRTGIKTLRTWRRLSILPAILTPLLHRICRCPFLIFILLWNVEHWVSHKWNRLPGTVREYRKKRICILSFLHGTAQLDNRYFTSAPCFYYYTFIMFTVSIDNIKTKFWK